jgi:hypothetical protein
MGFRFHGANQTCGHAQWEKLHTNCDSSKTMKIYFYICNKMGGGKSTTNEHNNNDNHIHI